MEVVKQKGSIQYDYLFKFDDYVNGWEQFVGINLKDEIPFIAEIRWVQQDTQTDWMYQNNFKILNPSTYRDFPIGNAMERISQYIEMTNLNKGKFKKTDYFKLLNYAHTFRSAYPQLQTKWGDERNVLLYISYYFLFINNELSEYSSGDLHSDIGQSLGITKANSVQILNRLKKRGYLENTDTTNSLIPSSKTIDLFTLESVNISVLDEHIRDTLKEQIESDEDYQYQLFEEEFFNDIGNVIGSTLEEDKNCQKAFDDYFSELLANIEDYPISDLCGLTSITSMNKFVSNIDTNNFVQFYIEDEILKEIRKSKKYKNDFELVLNEDLIVEILSELNIPNYDIESKLAEQVEYINTKKVNDEDEAPF